MLDATMLTVSELEDMLRLSLDRGALDHASRIADRILVLTGWMDYRPQRGRRSLLAPIERKRA